MGGGLDYGSIDGIAVDGRGNVFFADPLLNAVGEIQAAGGYSKVYGLGKGFELPSAVWLDGSANVYVTDSYFSDVSEITAASGYSTVATLASNFNEPTGLAMDVYGGLYVVDYGDSAVYQLQFAEFGLCCKKKLGGGFKNPDGLALDAGGNVFVADTGNSAVKEIPSGCVSAGCVRTLGSGFAKPRGVAVDGSGNVFVADTGNNRIVKLDLADAPSLSFASTRVGTASAEQKVTVQNIGNQPLIYKSIGVSSNFALVSADTTCAVGKSVPAGGNCILGIQFVPKKNGALSGSVTLTDNALNTNPASQVIPLDGTGTGSN